MPLNPGTGRGIYHIDVDQRVVAHDVAFGRVDESHASDVRGELINDVEPRGLIGQGFTTSLGISQIENLKVIRCGFTKFRRFDINPANPIPLLLQALHQMTCDKTTRSAYKCLSHFASKSLC